MLVAAPAPAAVQGHCDVGGQCQCYPGWFGEDCGLPDCLRNCSGHGACTLKSVGWLDLALVPEAVCECEPGWRGMGCEVRECPGRVCAQQGGECYECSGHGARSTAKMAVLMGP